MSSPSAPPSPGGAVVVITGCTQGLGYHCLLHLAAMPSSDAAPAPLLLLACRNVAAARAAAAAVTAKTRCGAARLAVLPEPLDLSDAACVRTYAAALSRFLAARRLHISALVNNAGIGGAATLARTPAGHDLIFASNHLGHFLLTLLLLPRLASPSRIVNVSSEVHDPANKTPLPDPCQHWPTTAEQYRQRLLAGEPLPGEDARTSGSRRYTRSKACNVMFSHELAWRLNGSPPHGLDADAEAAAAAAPGRSSCTLPAAAHVTVLSMNPGLMLDTGFVARLVGPFLGAVIWLLKPLLLLTPLGRFLRSAPVSGQHLAELAVGPLPAACQRRTCYFDGRALKPSSEFTRLGRREQRELWLHSLVWAEVTPEELAAAGLSDSA